MSSLNLSPAALLTVTAAQRPDATVLIYEAVPEWIAGFAVATGVPTVT